MCWCTSNPFKRALAGLGESARQDALENVCQSAPRAPDIFGEGQQPRDGGGMAKKIKRENS